VNTDKFDELSAREKAIIAGLFLSKFDKEGLTALGFKDFTEAFNVFGYCLGIKPNSLKNYRDEFDPLYPNKRTGRANRPIRDTCKKFYDDLRNYELESFSRLIQRFMEKNPGVPETGGQTRNRESDENLASRLVTGRAAEEYFKKRYQEEESFVNCEWEDTTEMGCGFDFKLICASDIYRYVEVKGLSAKRGNISLTEKEYSVADKYRTKFCLFVVLNFIEEPYHKTYFDPLHGGELSFHPQERQVTQISYQASL